MKFFPSSSESPSPFVPSTVSPVLSFHPPSQSAAQPCGKPPNNFAEAVARGEFSALQAARVVWIGNIQPFFSDEILHSLFGPHRFSISAVRLIPRGACDSLSGYAFAIFDTPDNASAAINALNGKIVPLHPPHQPPVNFKLKLQLSNKIYLRACELLPLIARQHQSYLAELTCDVTATLATHATMFPVGISARELLERTMNTPGALKALGEAGGVAFSPLPWQGSVGAEWPQTPELGHSACFGGFRHSFDSFRPATSEFQCIAPRMSADSRLEMAQKGCGCRFFSLDVDFNCN